MTEKIDQSNRERYSSTTRMPFLSYLTDWADYIKGEQRKLGKLCEMSVTLRRRNRGLTLSDMVGRYGIRRETNGKWLDYDPVLDGDIHPINIVQPAFRANTNACLQSNAAVNIEAANSAARMKQIADRWQKVADYFERLDWREDERAFMWDAVQNDGTILYYVYDEPEESYEAHKPKKTDKGFELAAGKLETVNIRHKLIPFFNYTIDSYGALSKGIESASWMQIQELVPRPELETEYKHFDFGSPSGWGYQLQCAYALASADWRYLNQGFSADSNKMSGFDRFEKRSIYLHESAYKNYYFDDAFEFINGAGERTFKAKKGDCIADAYEREYDKNPEGLKFIVTDDRLIDIVSPEIDKVNFRKCFSAVHWNRDSSSFHSSPNYSIVHIQDDITLLNTMNHGIIARNAVIPVFYDSLVFDQGDFSNEFIGTKNNALLPDDGRIDGSVKQLPIPTPSPHLAAQLEFLWQVKDSVTMVQPALRGESAPGQPYAAQRQQLEQSYGVLTSALKSGAQAKVRVTTQKMQIAQERWTLEQFQSVASMFGEMWTDEDVMEMCGVDFTKDLICDYTPGSEMPQGNLERELKFQAGVSKLMEMLQAGAQLPADILAKIIQKIGDQADFDFDVSGMEAALGISQKRIIELQQLCSSFKGMSRDQIDQAKAMPVAMDEQGQPISEMDLLTEQVFAESTIRFNKYENLDEQTSAFVESLNLETGKQSPNWFYIEMLEVILGMIEIAQQQRADEAMQNDPAYKEQLRIADEAKKAEDARVLAERQVEVEDKQMEDAAAQRDSAIDLIKIEAEHENDVELENVKFAHQKELVKMQPKPTTRAEKVK